MGRRSAGAAPSSHYRSVTKHCKALRPISLSGRTVRLQRTLATSEPLGSVSLPPTRPAVWLQFWGRVGGNASLNCNKDRQGALAATGKGRVGGDACLSCYIGRQCALAARGAATIGQLRGQRSPHKSYGRWFRCTVAASAASEGQVSPTRPPCGAAPLCGGRVGGNTSKAATLAARVLWQQQALQQQGNLHGRQAKVQVTAHPGQGPRQTTFWV